MKTGYDKAKRVADAAMVVLDAEAYWSAGESAPGAYQTEMRELKAASTTTSTIARSPGRRQERRCPLHLNPLIRSRDPRATTGRTSSTC
jgi:hypothetical protein